MEYIDKKNKIMKKKKLSVILEDFMYWQQDQDLSMFDDQINVQKAIDTYLDERFSELEL